MLELAALAVIGVVLFALAMVGMLLLKAVLWLVVLPLRLIFGLVLLPLLLVVKLLVGGVLFLVVGPIVLIGTFVALLAVGAAVLTPLLPLIAIGLVIWAVVKIGRTPAPIPRA